MLKQGRASKKTKKCPRCEKVLDRVLNFKERYNRTSSYCNECAKGYASEKHLEKMKSRIGIPRKRRELLVVTPEVLFSKTDGNGDPEACWNWLMAKNGKGYGRTCSNGKSHYTHRLSWELINGEIKDGLFVLHRCDNPSCINPSHLFLGTQKQNLEDMHAKGRNAQPTGFRHGSKTKPEKIARGERISNSKLKEDQVIEIRQLKESSGISNRAIAKLYNVTPPTIRGIVNGTAWIHI